jgi:hypothetical protein
MNIVDRHADDLARIARRHGVKRLELFGSAARGDFDSQASDLDFLVEFGPEPPGGVAHAYFDLLDALTDLFGRRIDLVSSRAIRNPYLLASINETRRAVYDAQA